MRSEQSALHCGYSAYLFSYCPAIIAVHAALSTTPYTLLLVDISPYSIFEGENMIRTHWALPVHNPARRSLCSSSRSPSCLHRAPHVEPHNVMISVFCAFLSLFCELFYYSVESRHYCERRCFLDPFFFPSPIRLNGGVSPVLKYYRIYFIRYLRIGDACGPHGAHVRSCSRSLALVSASLHSKSRDGRTQLRTNNPEKKGIFARAPWKIDKRGEREVER